MHDVTITSDDFVVTTTSECAGVAGTPANVASLYVLVIGAVPVSVVAGAVIAPAITATVQDLSGATLTSSTAPVTITLVAAGGAVLSGTTTVNAVNGIATISDLSVDKTGSTFTFAVAMSGATTVTGGVFAVTASAASRLTILQRVTVTGISGTAWPTQPVVAVQNALGNTVTTSTPPLTLRS